MSSTSILLAGLSLADFLANWHDPRKRGTVIGLGAVVVMTLVLLWLLISLARETGHHHHHHHHRHSDNQGHGASDEAGQIADSSGLQKRRKWRRRRRDHRPRNPTLAETGGLPPLRSQAQPPSSESRP